MRLYEGPPLVRGKNFPGHENLAAREVPKSKGKPTPNVDGQRGGGGGEEGYRRPLERARNEMHRIADDIATVARAIA